MSTPEHSERWDELAPSSPARRPTIGAVSGSGGSASMRARPAAPRPAKAAASRRTIIWRRMKLGAVLGVLAAVAVGIALTAKVRPERRLPLEDQALIREQAEDKNLDPALIAAVIYAETKFVPRESSAGAEGLMQILPSTAEYLAHLSHGTTFTVADLGDPSVNIAYGSYYLRYLMNHYGDEELPAVAAYNAGLTNVDKWERRAKANGKALSVSEIPFPQTRAYVEKVLSAEQQYQRIYPHQLGLR
jgi:soluble lytic murein transglycosylase